MPRSSARLAGAGARRLSLVLGGAIGTLVRHGLAQLPDLGSGAATFPLGTLIANVVGALTLGAVVGWLRATNASGQTLRDPAAWTPLTAGVIGATTTFSTFIIESADLLEARPLLGVANVVISLVLGFAAVVIGRRIAGGDGRGPDRSARPVAT